MSFILVRADLDVGHNYDFFLVDPACLRSLHERIERLERLRGDDLRLKEMSYMTDPTTVFGCASSALEEHLGNYDLEAVAHGDFIVTEWIDPPPIAREPIECASVVIHYNGLYFSGFLPGLDGKMETGLLDAAALLCELDETS